MNKILSTFIFIILTVATSNAQSALRIAPEAGLNATALTFTVPELYKQGKGTSKSPLLPGVRAGVTASFKTISGLRPGIGVFLSRRSANFENPKGALTQYTTYKDRMFVLEVPVFLEYHFSDTRKSHFFAGLVAQLNVNTGGTRTYMQNVYTRPPVGDLNFGKENTDDYKPTDVSAFIMAGYQLGKAFFLKAQFGTGLTEMARINYGPDYFVARMRLQTTVTVGYTLF